MSLPYSYIDWSGPIPVPPRAVNGGLYTGTPFAPNATWGNVPVEPEAHVMNQNLPANAPASARKMIPSATRPGNNHVTYLGVTEFNKNTHENLLCFRD